MIKILIIEDEKPISELLKYGLEQEGFEASCALTGESGIRAIDIFEPDLVLLDIMLPDIDGLTICRTVTMEKNIPIILLTAKSSQIDKLIGLEYGADDYITKPFDIREVVLRIKSILRRIEKARKEDAYQDVLRAGNIELDMPRHQVFVNGKEIDLTPKEFSLLEMLMKNQGKVLSRAELLAKVWEFEYIGDTRTVDIHVQRLRKKLGDEKIIQTVFGVGYKIADE